MGSSPLTGEVQEVLIGLLIGGGVSLLAQYLFPWRNLRWTWALFALPLGGLPLLAGIVESWSVALVFGGVVTARWAYVLERRDVESGGDARRRARDAVGPVDVLAKRRSLRQAGQGNVNGPGEFLLGHNRRRRPVSLRFGGASGRHGLLLGASGSGKSNSLLWCLARHIDAGFGAVVIDMKGDQLLARRLQHEARAADVDYYQWTLDGGDRWNPLAHGNRSELKDKLIASEEFSERHYQAMYERYLLNLFRALESQAEQRDLQTVIRLLDPPELSAFMGHSSITITLDRYGHLFPGSEEQAAGLLDTYLERTIKAAGE